MEAGAVSEDAQPAEGAQSSPSTAPRRRLELGTAEDFALFDHEGELRRLFDQDDHRAVVLVSYGIGCPILRWSLPRIEELAKRYGDEVAFFYVDPNAHDPRPDLAKEVREFGLEVPILHDEAQLVLGGLGVQRTAEALLIDTRDWRVAYRGKVDDRSTYGSQSGGTKVDYLADAIEAFLEDELPPVQRTQTEGCLIFFEHDAPPSYTEVADVLARRCMPCHAEGGAAPFAMSSYGRVRGWSEMIREVIRTRLMPPWHADPHVGTFENDRALTPEEASTVVRWVEAGAPKGEDEPDPMPAAAAEENGEEWPLGEPDLVLQARESELPATGTLPYLYQYAPIEVEEDLWVRGVHLKPSNARVLHHALILLEYPEHLKHKQPNYSLGIGAYFALYIPGMQPRLFPGDSGKYLPAGSKVIFQFHYTTTGRPETDQPSLALYLHEGRPPVKFASTSALKTELDIPPGERVHLVSEKLFVRDVWLHDLIPHMHYRGKSIRYDAHYPDGKVETLLSVPDYDFNWQTSYQLAEKKFIPKGTLVKCFALFDNTDRNPRNPDPTQRVTWGEESSDEMLIGYMNYSVPFPGDPRNRAETQAGPGPGPAGD